MRIAPERIAAWVTLAASLRTFSLRFTRALWCTAAACTVTLALGSLQTTEASVTYYYTGQPFILPTLYCGLGCTFVQGKVTATVAYNSPTNFPYSLSADGFTFNSESPDSLFPFFDVSDTGQVTVWSLSAGDTSVLVSTDNYGFGDSGDSGDSLLIGKINGGCSVVSLTGSGLNFSPGTWTTILPSITVAAETGGIPSTTGQDTAIVVTATPTDAGLCLPGVNCLQQVASALGYPDGLDWTQTVLSLPTPSPVYQVGNPIPLFAPPGVQ
jgi:hypothetical protein